MNRVLFTFYIIFHHCMLIIYISLGYLFCVYLIHCEEVAQCPMDGTKKKKKLVTKNAHLFNLLLFRGNNGVEFQTNRQRERGREWMEGGLKIANVEVNVFCSLIHIWWLRMCPFNRIKIKEGTTYWYTHVTHSCTRI